MNKKLKIMRNFSKSAKLYDKNAGLQKDLENILLEKVAAGCKQSGLVLDIGSGTGSFCRKVAALNPTLSIYGLDIAWGMVEYSVRRQKKGMFLQGDAEEIPFKDGLFDMVISSSVYQWVEDLEKAFSEAGRVLRRDGLFYFIFFGGRTLEELKVSFDKAYQCFGLEPCLHAEDFFTIGDIEGALKKAGFKSRLVDSLVIQKRYNTIGELLRFLKITGASNANLSNAFGLGRRKIMAKMIDIYRTLFTDDGHIRTTFEVFLGTAVR